MLVFLVPFDLLVKEIARKAQFLGERHGMALPLIGPRLCGGGFGGAVIMAVEKTVVGHFLSFFNPGKSDYENATGIVPTPYVVQVCGSGECTIGQALSGE